jgi:hypothetical protein
MFLAVVLFAVMLITLLVLAYVRFQDRPRSPQPPPTSAIDAPAPAGAVIVGLGGDRSGNAPGHATRRPSPTEPA